MISIVICSIDAGKFAAVREQYARALGNEPHEIIGIHDAKSLCEGYNRGLRQSRGEIVVFSHDDVEIWNEPGELAGILKRRLGEFDVIGVAGTRKLVGPAWYASGSVYGAGQVAHRVQGAWVVAIYGARSARVMPGMQAMEGLVLAFRRDAIERLKWDEATFTGFHMYDLDVTYRAYRAGMKLAISMELLVLHQSGGTFAEEWEKWGRIFLKKHGATLEKLPERGTQHAAVLLGSREAAIQEMRALVQSLP